MRRIGTAAVVVAAIGALIVSPAVGSAASPSANPASPELASVSTTGLGGDDDSGNFGQDGAVSDDGRDVVFSSHASDLVANDVNDSLDVFVRDRNLGTTALVDVDASGAQPAAGFAYQAKISGDGRFVAFLATSALVPGDTNGRYDAYVRDLETDRTVRVSLAADGSQLSQGATQMVQLSDDGRYAAYMTTSPEVTGATDGSRRAIVVVDRDADDDGVFDEVGGTATSVVADGQLGSMSPNGRYLGYRHLVGGPDGDDYQTFVVDRGAPSADGGYEQAPTTTLVSAEPDGTEGAGFNGPGYVSDLGDVAFDSGSANLGADPASNASVLVRDHDGTIELVAPTVSNQPTISGDGRYVASDGCCGRNLQLYDRTTHEARLVAENGVNPNLSPSGGNLTFARYGTADLPAGSPRRSNVFVVDLTGSGDSAGPEITVTTPSDGAAYAVGQVVLADYACSDPSGIATCAGPVADGDPIDTSTPGRHDFTVTASDSIGNPDSTTVSDVVGDAVSIGDSGAVEGDSGRASVLFPVTLDAAAPTATRISYATSDDTATAGSDYVARDGVVTVPAGATSATIAVALKPDAAVEPDETFDVTLTGVSPSSRAFVDDGLGVGTIVDDDHVSGVSVGDAAVLEGPAGATVSLAFPVSLDRPAETPIKLSYATSDLTAAAPADYRAKRGTLTAAAGSSAGTITVAIVGDDLPENDEAFTLSLTGISSGPGELVDDTATGTIRNDDVTPVASIGDAAVAEGDQGRSFLTFPVTLDRPAAAAVRLTYATADGTAASPADYTAKKGVVTIAKAATTATIVVTVRGDRVVESDETLTAELTGVRSGPAVVSPSNGSAVGTIVDDD